MLMDNIFWNFFQKFTIPTTQPTNLQWNHHENLIYISFLRSKNIFSQFCNENGWILGTFLDILIQLEYLVLEKKIHESEFKKTYYIKVKSCWCI